MGITQQIYTLPSKQPNIFVTLFFKSQLMKNWKAVEWCLFLLTLTIPLCLLGVGFIRMATNSIIPPETAALILSQNKETK